MSTSYQDIDTRVVGLENALTFLMRSLKVREMLGSPLDPHPLVREVDMLTYYREQLGKGLLEASQAEPEADPVIDTPSESDGVPNVA